MRTVSVATSAREPPRTHAVQTTTNVPAMIAVPATSRGNAGETRAASSDETTSTNATATVLRTIATNRSLSRSRATPRARRRNRLSAGRDIAPEGALMRCIIGFVRTEQCQWTATRHASRTGSQGERSDQPDEQAACPAAAGIAAARFGAVGDSVGEGLYERGDVAIDAHIGG